MPGVFNKIVLLFAAHVFSVCGQSDDDGYALAPQSHHLRLGKDHGVG